LRHACEGGNIIIAAERFPGLLTDTFNIDVSYFDGSYFYGASHNVRFCAPLAVPNLSFPEDVLYRYFAPNEDDSAKAVAWEKQYKISETDSRHALSIRCRIGQGNLILICNPLIFTNYGILNDSISPYIWQHLGYLSDRPLIRLEHYVVTPGRYDSRTPLAIVMDGQATRWALMVLLLMLSLIMIFSARRKQKPIPIIRPPKNMMLDFVRSITGLYLQKNDNADIILKRKLYLSEEIKRKHGIDLINTDRNEACVRLAQKTGYSPEYIRNCMAQLNAVTSTTHLSDEKMMALVEITRQLLTENDAISKSREKIG
jgi:hypothetical protein